MKNVIRVRTGNESGQVSIITVIVFILLFSVLVISFSRIMVTASRQAVNDELAASAKAAAESGVEDAKRILSYCTAGGAGCDMLDKVIEESNCTTISSSSALMNSLQREVSSGSSIKVGDGSNNEEYLCLKMTMITPDYLDSLTTNGNTDGKSESVVIPLKFTTGSNGAPISPRSVRIQWHNTSPDYDGDATLLAGSDLPAADKWGMTNPAVLRAEFVAVPKSGFKIDDLTNNTRALTLRPSSSATDTTNVTSASTGLYSLDSWIKQTEPNAINPKVFILRTGCQSGSSGDGYACSALFTIPKVPGSGGTNYIFDTETYDYYLRLQATYNSTHFRISAKDDANRDIFFDRVQAGIDVTGRAMDSLKRLSIRLNPDNGDDSYLWWPDYAVDTAGKVCKNMRIEAWEGEENCVD